MRVRDFLKQKDGPVSFEELKKEFVHDDNDEELLVQALKFIAGGGWAKIDENGEYVWAKKAAGDTPKAEAKAEKGDRAPRPKLPTRPAIREEIFAELRKATEGLTESELLEKMFESFELKSNAMKDWVSDALDELESCKLINYAKRNHIYTLNAEADFDHAQLPNPRTADEIADAEVDWVVQGLMPSGIVMIAGQPGAGKSWLAVELCRAITTGTSFCGKWECKRGVAVYIDLEGELTETKRRCKRVFGKISDELYMDDHIVLDAQYVRPFIAKYKETVGKRKVRLIVIDSLVSAHEAKESSAEEMNAVFKDALMPLKEAFPEAVILLVHHIRKPSVTDETWAVFRGSGNILAQVRAGYVVKPVEDEGISIECAKLRVGKHPKPAMVKINDTDNEGISISYAKELFAPVSLSVVEQCMQAIISKLKSIAQETKQARQNIERAVRCKREIVEMFEGKFPARIVGEALEIAAEKNLISRIKRGCYAYLEPVEVQAALSNV